MLYKSDNLEVVLVVTCYGLVSCAVGVTKIISIYKTISSRVCASVGMSGWGGGSGQSAHRCFCDEIDGDVQTPVPNLLYL